MAITGYLDDVVIAGVGIYLLKKTKDVLEDSGSFKKRINNKFF